MTVPKGILIDLDDTILDDSGGIPASWTAVCREARTLQGRLDANRLYEAISRHRAEFWADAERHRVGRQQPRDANRRIVHAALQDLGFYDEGLAAHLADCYLSYREQHRTIIPGAVEAIKRFKESGTRLALITNEGTHGQRSKIERFGLARHFDGISSRVSWVSANRTTASTAWHLRRSERTPERRGASETIWSGMWWHLNVWGYSASG